jgi:hypothetical protein
MHQGDVAPPAANHRQKATVVGPVEGVIRWLPLRSGLSRW